jgi:LPXTG-site transpeptidase (sortase) family protein
MKASASILLSFVVGALVTVALVGWGPLGDAAPPQAAPAQRMHAVEPKPARAAEPKPASLAPRRVQSQPLINIPGLGLKATIGTSLNRGPAWWPVTGRPGGGDTIAIAGHRTTHSRPFYSLDRLMPGDSIYVRWAGRMHAYRVSGRRILSSKQLHIGDARGHEVLLLSACHPRGSARQRIVVYAWPRA